VPLHPGDVMGVACARVRAELARLEHTRRYAMALLVTFMGYDDFRHQVSVRAVAAQPLPHAGLFSEPPEDAC
jgi:hypothetical protein